MNGGFAVVLGVKVAVYQGSEETCTPCPGTCPVRHVSTVLRNQSHPLASPPCAAAGTYGTSDATNGGLCTTCGAGTFGPFAGLSDQSATAGNQNKNCFVCPPGAIAAVGATECDDCPGPVRCTPLPARRCSYPSLTSPPRRSLLVARAAGTYASTDGTKCTACPAGQYSYAGFADQATTAGVPNCIVCAPGKITAAGATECDDCPGPVRCTQLHARRCSYPSLASLLVARAAGTYASTDGTTCTACPVNQFSYAGLADQATTASPNAHCLPCATGTFAAPGGSCLLNPLPSPLPVVVNTPPPPVPKPPATGKDPKMPKDGEPNGKMPPKDGDPKGPKKMPPAQYHNQRSLRLKVDGDVTDSGEASAVGIHTRMGM